MRLLSVILLLAILLAIGGFAAFHFLHSTPPAPLAPPAVQMPVPEHHLIGTSVQGREIDEYTYGTGTTTLLFVGGIHGAYEWNASALAYQFIDYLNAHPEAVPKNEKITVIPDLNPDAFHNGLGLDGHFTNVDNLPADLSKYRTNANGVDLNRNFDCNWSPHGVWQAKPENTGTAAFSEPETRALRDFALAERPVAVVFWHSASNAVYASQCNNGILPETLEVMNTYAKAAGYQAIKEFDAYIVTGAGEDWLASQNIPAITVELSSHDKVEWDKNILGIEALISHFAQ